MTLEELNAAQAKIEDATKEHERNLHAYMGPVTNEALALFDTDQCKFILGSFQALVTKCPKGTRARQLCENIITVLSESRRPFEIARQEIEKLQASQSVPQAPAPAAPIAEGTPTPQQGT